VCLYVQSGMTPLILACAEGDEKTSKMLAAPTQAAGAIDVPVCAWLSVCLSLLWAINVLVYNPSWDFEGVNMTGPVTGWCGRAACGWGFRGIV